MKRNTGAAYQARRYAMAFIGTPYLWGGNDPMEGFDCSNFVVEVLKSQGIVKDDAYINSHGLWVFFHDKRVAKADVGCLVFYGQTDQGRITHVGFCCDERTMLEAGHGDSRTTSIEAASAKNAFIKMRPITRRADLVGFCDPFMEGKS